MAPKPRWVPRGPPPTTVPPLNDQAEWPLLVPPPPPPPPAQPEQPLPPPPAQLPPPPLAQPVESKDPSDLPEYGVFQVGDITVSPSKWAIASASSSAAKNSKHATIALSPSRSPIASSSSSAAKHTEPDNASSSEKAVEVRPECEKKLFEEEVGKNASFQPSQTSTPTGPCHSPRQDSILTDIASSSSSVSEKPVVTRDVWESNLTHEFGILKSIIDKYPFVTVDTEFPGDIHPRLFFGAYMPPDQVYNHIRRNVNPTSLIQVGLTLTDADGNLPDLDTDRRYIWEFNFHFDPSSEENNPESIKMLRKAGFNFEERLDKQGVKTPAFAKHLLRSGLVSNREVVVWIAFHGDHDFAYLVKALTGNPLPETLPAFLTEMDNFFGRVYDVKHLMEKKNHQGGLNRIAEFLKLDRAAAGTVHQAGSDSLLTSTIFWKLRKDEDYFLGDDMKEFAGIVYGLQKY